MGYTAGASASCIVGTVCGATTRLDTDQLAGIAQELCDASLADSSRKTYRAAQKSYISFCQAVGVQPVPASKQLLILFVAEASQEVCYSTIRMRPNEWSTAARDGPEGR